MQARQYTTSDPRLISVEIYNPYTFDLFIRLDQTKLLYIQTQGVPVGRDMTLRAGEHLFLPHQYFAIFDINNEVRPVVANYGKLKGIKNTKVSKPEFDLG